MTHDRNRLDAQIYLERSPYGTLVPTLIVSAPPSNEPRLLLSLMHTVVAEVLLRPAANRWTLRIAPPRFSPGLVVKAAVHVELDEGSDDADVALALQALADGLAVIRQSEAPREK